MKHGDQHLQLAKESLSELLKDERVPDAIRHELSQDYAELERMLRKLEDEQIHIAVFGRVSVGKSALLNALLGETRFSTSPLHGETRDVAMGEWQEYLDGNVLLIDTPGINEVAGEERERLAANVAGRADLVLFVVDGDITETEMTALRQIYDRHVSIVLVLNKADRYGQQQILAIEESLRRHTQGLISADDLVRVAAAPMEQIVIRVDKHGQEVEEWRQPAVDVEQLRKRLLVILEREGKSLAAVNATLFASQLGDEVGHRILLARQHLGEKLVRTYCIAKGVAVALNPVPVADLVAAVVVDVSLIVHLSKLYGLPLTRSEAGELIKVIGAQMALLMGSVWLIHFVSSMLKLGTGGLSALVTGTAQGALAYYTTYVVGQAAKRYLARGKSWGQAGPKSVVRDIIDSIDRDSLIAEAREDIRKRLKTSSIRR